MTSALCFNCGKIKFGALCPCLNCNHEPEGISELEIMFTDHFFPRKFLELLGKDLEKLKSLKSNNEVALQAFFIHTNQQLNNDDFKLFEIVGETKEAEELLKQADLPKHDLVKIKEEKEKGFRGFLFIIMLLFGTTVYLLFKVIQKLIG